MIHIHESKGFERDIRLAIERWGIAKSLQMPASVLATYVIASIVAIEAANRRSEEIAAAEEQTP